MVDLITKPMMLAPNRKELVKSRLDEMNRMIARVHGAEYVGTVSYNQIPWDDMVFHQGIRLSDNREIGYNDEQMEYFKELVLYANGLTKHCPAVPASEDLGLPPYVESIELRLRLQANKHRRGANYRPKRFS